jgi:hypothetical protein
MRIMSRRFGQTSQDEPRRFPRRKYFRDKMRLADLVGSEHPRNIGEMLC